ncbi:MAG: aromatic ring-hydroxylating dioxygenase subunit alpha [Pseudomonadota bacterium]
MGSACLSFRTDGGEVRALQDRCPHRMAPLSLGKVDGDKLQCLYHGAQFNGVGRCVAIPGQSDDPGPGYKVDAYPTAEQYGYIWVWMGDPDKMSEVRPPMTFAPCDDQSWIGGYGRFEGIKAGYKLINDNLFDITHAEFVHPESFGGEEVRFYRDAQPGADFVDRAMTYDVHDEEIVFRTAAVRLEKEVRGPLWAMLLAQSRGLETWDDPIKFQMEVRWNAPCYTSFHISVWPVDEPDSEPAQIINLHAAVPETATSSHYFYSSLRSYGDESMNESFTDAAAFIFGQDKPILEGQQANIGNEDLFDLSPKSFRGDRLQLEARRILDRMLSDEISNSASPG